MSKKLTVILLITILLFMGLEVFKCEEKEKLFSLKGNNKVGFISKIKNCGATTSYNQKLYMVASNERINIFDSPIIEVNDDNLVLEWVNSNTLIITTDSNRIFKFRNFIYINNEEYRILLEQKIKK